MWGEETVAHPQLPWLLRGDATLPHHPRTLFLGFVCLSSFFLRVTSTSLPQLPRWHISNHSYAWRMFPFTIVFVSSFSSKWKKKKWQWTDKKGEAMSSDVLRRAGRCQKNHQESTRLCGTFWARLLQTMSPFCNEDQVFLIEFVKISDWGWSIPPNEEFILLSCWWKLLKWVKSILEMYFFCAEQILPGLSGMFMV